MKEKGFTIVELMIVMAIIGIVAAIAIPAFQKSTGKTSPKKSVQQNYEAEFNKESSQTIKF